MWFEMKTRRLEKSGVFILLKACTTGFFHAWFGTVYAFHKSLQFIKHNLPQTRLYCITCSKIPWIHNNENILSTCQSFCKQLDVGGSIYVCYHIRTWYNCKEIKYVSFAVNLHILNINSNYVYPVVLIICIRWHHIMYKNKGR